MRIVHCKKPDAYIIAWQGAYKATTPGVGLAEQYLGASKCR
ncbi:MAG: hypothetical protein WBV73_23700 [Phormidium sp.]